VCDSAWYNTWPLSIILPRFNILEDLGCEEAWRMVMPFFGFVFRSQEPRAADWNLDRFPFSTEPKIPIGARKLALPVLSTQESSAVAPKQKRGKGKEEKKKQILWLQAFIFICWNFPRLP
jgi:hypothetical protein